MNSHSHFVALVPSVQGVNAVTGQPIDAVRLEQYAMQCPVHQAAFASDRFCASCGFKWPHQNYITNAAGSGSQSEFWIDGWRTRDGKIRQFVFSAAGEGLGVAEQVLGERRALGIGFAIYLSKDPKPVQPRRILRGGDPEASLGSYDSSQFLGLDGLESTGIKGTLGGAESYSGARSAPTLRRMASFDTPRRVGPPMQVEVSHGREVDQKVHPDPHELDFWREEPEATFVLTPTDAAWVAELVRNGPTVDLTAGGMGPLAGLRGVGND